MSRLDLAQLKGEIVINAAMRLMLQAAPHGYTFDSVELLPYEGVGEGIAYRLWVRDAQGEKMLGYQDILSMLICHGEQTKKKEEQKSTRMRRFLLQGVERRFECILYSNGCVAINIHPDHYRTHFESLEAFREVHGEEILWIDEEQ